MYPNIFTKYKIFLLYAYTVSLKQWHTLPVSNSGTLTGYQNNRDTKQMDMTKSKCYCWYTHLHLFHTKKNPLFVFVFLLLFFVLFVNVSFYLLPFIFLFLPSIFNIATNYNLFLNYLNIFPTKIMIYRWPHKTRFALWIWQNAIDGNKFVLKQLYAKGIP